MRFWLTNLEEGCSAGDAGNVMHAQSTSTHTESPGWNPEEQLCLRATEMLLQKFADFIRTGTSADCPMHQSKTQTRKSIYPIQPEVRHSVHGYDILRNFALNICGAKGTGPWITLSRCKSKNKSVKRWRQTFSLVFQWCWLFCCWEGFFSKKAPAINWSVSLDHGLLRKGEADQVMDMLAVGLVWTLSKLMLPNASLINWLVSDPEIKT